MSLGRLTYMCAAVALVAGVASVTLIATGKSGRASERTSLGSCRAEADVVSRRSCIEHAIRTDVGDSGVDAAFDRLERTAERDASIAADCHMALHPIGADEGERLARAGASLPLPRPRSFCHEGYVHGLQVAWLDAASTPHLVRDGARSCDASDANVDWACGHSLGHVLARRAGAGGMPTAATWCASTYRSAVHLGLDREAFLTTCMKGALMEFVLLDERAKVTDMERHACGAVRDDLLPWCEGHVWLRADVATPETPTVELRLAACDQLATTTIGRSSCAGMVGRSVASPDRCTTTAQDLAQACRTAAKLGPIDPAAVPAS